VRFDVAALDRTRCARLLTGTVVPRPIAWVTTLSAAGARNAAPFSFFNILCSWPPVLGIGMQPRDDGSPKDTLANILATGAFVVNLVGFAQARAMNVTGAALPPDKDEIALAGLTAIPSAHIPPPRLAEAPAAFECTLRQTIQLGEGRMIVLGDILAAHIVDHAVLDPDSCGIDATVLDLVARMHGPDEYLTTRDIFSLPRSPGGEVSEKP
jgi:flavin reductase (DIM6/NTAB) family NADH-FMN oxidoreductase RutF